MKVNGKDAKIFIGDQEIKEMTSFSFSTGDASKHETLTFTGTYDPVDKDEVEEYFKALQAKGEDVITTNIYNYDGEFREAKVRMSYQDGQITLEPVDTEIREWIKGWMI